MLSQLQCMFLVCSHRNNERFIDSKFNLIFILTRPKLFDYNILILQLYWLHRRADFTEKYHHKENLMIRELCKYLNNNFLYHINLKKKASQFYMTIT